MWGRVARTLPFDLYPLDHNILDGTVARAGAGGRDRVDDLLRAFVGDLTEDRVLPVEPVRRGDGDEELRPVGTGAGVRHGEQVRPVEGQLGVDLVAELVPRATPPGTGRVASLDHEVVDDAVKDRAVVVRTAALLAGARVDVLA